jgi:ribonuclease HI
MNYDVHIYTDGAARKPGKGGYGVVMESVKWVKPTAKNFTKGLG